jgi:hypothetical protein
MEGSFVANGPDVTFSAIGGSLVINPTQRTDFHGAFAGDSIVFSDSLALWTTSKLVFRRAQLTAPVHDGTYVLSSVNGRADLVLRAGTLSSGTRFMTRVDYDTIGFKDGVLFQSSREESARNYNAAGDSVLGSARGWHVRGWYDGDDDHLIFHYDLTPPNDVSNADTLTVDGTELVRRTTGLSWGDLEERYTRISN